MSILTNMLKIVNSQWSIVNRLCSIKDKSQATPLISKALLPWAIDHGLWTILLIAFTFTHCTIPHEDIVLRSIKDVVVDAASEPTLKANAVFYNPNSVSMRLKKINVEVYVDGKKVANVNQDLKTVIPARDEFSIPLEVKLAMKELGFMDTLFGVLGGKKFNVVYKGYLKLNYHGLPIRVPVEYSDDIRIKF